jgi:hypothetical protein
MGNKRLEQHKMVIQWQRYLPGISGISVIQTSDGGYLALGQNASIDNVSGEFTNYTSIAVKTDESGNPIWAKTYSVATGITETRLIYAVETSGGYILAGTLTPAAYGFPERFCLIKINLNGDIVWNKTYARGVPDETYEVGGFISTSDGGCALVGSYSGPQPSIAYLWFVKVDSAGNLQWNRTLAINNSLFSSSYMPGWLAGRASSLFQTNDGEYVIIGTLASRVISPSYAEIVKLDSDGNVEWYRTYGGEEDYYHTLILSAAATADGGYMMAGSAAPSGGAEKGIVFKADSEGNMEWNKTYTYPGTIYSISRANDGGFMFVGMASETLLDTISGRYIWAWQVDSLGNIQLQSAIKKVDNYFFTKPASLIQCSDGGYVFTGVSIGPHDQANQLTADDKFWIIKISKSELTVTPNSDNNLYSTAWILSGIVIVAVVVVGFFVYFKKRNHAGINKHSEIEQSSA